MIIKEHNTNNYVSIKKSDFPNHSQYYQEIMRIQFNKVNVCENTVESIECKLSINNSEPRKFDHRKYKK